MSLKDTILALVKDQIKVQVVTGKIKSVDETKMICDIDLQNAPDLLDVRLRSIIDEQEKGILILPKVGSYVLVGLINNRPESSFVCGYSEVDKIRFLIDEIELSGDDFGGIVKSEKVTEEINKLSSDINQLKQFIASWVPAPQDGGAGLKAILSSWSTSTLQNVVQASLENEKVKHG